MSGQRLTPLGWPKPPEPTMKYLVTGSFRAVIAASRWKLAGREQVRDERKRVTGDRAYTVRREAPR